MTLVVEIIVKGGCGQHQSFVMVNEGCFLFWQPVLEFQAQTRCKTDKGAFYRVQAAPQACLSVGGDCVREKKQLAERLVW